MADDRTEPAYRINRWDRYEGTTRKPIKKMTWLPIFVHGHSVGAGYSRLARLAGAQLGNAFATFVKCLELAAGVPLDQPRDGTIWNHHDEPATAAEIAEYSLLPQARVQQALHWLTDPKCGWICTDVRTNAPARTNPADLPYRTGPKPKGPNKTGQDRTEPNRTEQDQALSGSDLRERGDSSASDFGGCPWLKWSDRHPTDHPKPDTVPAWRTWTVEALGRLFSTKRKLLDPKRESQGRSDLATWEDIAEQVVDSEGAALSVVRLAREKANCRSARNSAAMFVKAAQKAFAYKRRQKA